jgi:hypothetical protein
MLGGSVKVNSVFLVPDPLTPMAPPLAPRPRALAGVAAPGTRSGAA